MTKNIGGKKRMTSNGEYLDHYTHPYIPNTPADRQAMLEVIGKNSIDELFVDIPSEFYRPPLDLPDPLTEMELEELFEEIAAKNVRIDGKDGILSFLGSGTYRHYIPAAVDDITRNRKLLSAYTPYQPELGQGTLGTSFAWASYISALTGLDVVNTGMYEGASSFGESVRASVAITGRGKVVTNSAIRPNLLQVLKTYCRGQRVEVIETPLGEEPRIDGETAAVLIQSPNSLGYLEDASALEERARAFGAKVIVFANPMSLALVDPANCQPDFVVGNAQPFGIPPSYGGPHIGIFATKMEYLRKSPGRLVGQATDVEGRRSFVLTIQAREQHIKRGKATSNLCTAQQLMGARAVAYLSQVGSKLPEVAQRNHDNASYLASQIDTIPGYELPVSGSGTFFNEFVVTSPLPAAELNRRMVRRGFNFGVSVEGTVQNGIVTCVTEIYHKKDMDRLAEALADVAKEEGWR